MGDIRQVDVGDLGQQVTQPLTGDAEALLGLPGMSWAWISLSRALASLLLALALWSRAHSPIAQKDGGTRSGVCAGKQLSDLLPAFCSLQFHLGSLLPETFFLVPFGLPRRRRNATRGVVTEADERARLISLDAEHVSQEAPDRADSITWANGIDPFQALSRASLGAARSQRPVDLPAIAPGEERLEARNGLARAPAIAKVPPRRTP